MEEQSEIKKTVNIVEFFKHNLKTNKEHTQRN